MATGNGDGAPDEDGTGQCRVTELSPEHGKPESRREVATDSDPCEGSSGPGLGIRTYKRRKQLKRSSSATASLQDGMVQLETQNSKELQDRISEGTLFEQVQVSTLPSQGASDEVIDSSDGQWCKVVLEQMNHSLSEGEGLLGCIRKALHHPTETDSTKFKESISGLEGRRRPGDAAPAGSMCDGVAAMGTGCSLSGSMDEFSQQSVNDLCQRAFYSIIISRKFNMLCKFLAEKFQGSKIDCLLDFEVIHSRMKEGIYECSPARFCSDFEQVWRKLEEVGIELVSLAKNLENLSRISCHEHVGKAMHSTSDGENKKVYLQDPQCDTKFEQAEDWSVIKVSPCRCCGERARGRECLICDSCEVMYHVSCIEPVVEEIPLRNWYCEQCISNGKRSTHDSCVVCQRLCASKTTCTGVSEKITSDDTKKDLAYSGGDDMARPLRNSFGLCSICGSDVFEDEIIRECSHSLCAHGTYHERCLTAKQLKSYGPCWYCPSCLCRTCLSDQDDDKIILCDACDHAYHLYCVKPPLSRIPEGKWFCRKCEAGLQAILRVKRACEGINVKGKRGRKKLKDKVVKRGRRKRIKEETDKAGGGMDMLLNAADTLNFEENLVAVSMNG